MCCSAEEQVIQNKLGRMPEVKTLGFDLINQVLTVEHDFDSEEPLRKALSEIGMKPGVHGNSCDAEGHDHIHADDTSDKRENFLLGLSLVLAIASELVGWAIGHEKSPIVILLAILAILVGGRETFTKGLVAVKTFTLNINFLMCLAVVGAIVIGSWPEAAMVTVLFAIAEKIETYSLERASNAVRSLMKLAPNTALVSRNGAWVELDSHEVSLGERVRVKPGERIALDGIVVLGESAVNQAPITGESVAVEKSIGDKLFSGTINESGILEFEVTGVSGSTTLDRIIKTVQEAQASRAPTQRFVDSFAKYYTPTVVVLALLVVILPLAFGQPFFPWLYKALVLLVIACPCALVISTPVTVVSGLAAAARKGILIKGGAHLESGRNLSWIALDKTGTLTVGEPKVINIVAMHGFDENKGKQIAASLDHLSAHPVAKAIVDVWEGEALPVDGFASLSGRGVAGRVGGEPYILGNHRLVEERKVCCDHVHKELERLESEGKTCVILADAKEALVIFGVADTVRSESVDAINELHKLSIRVAMLTGDNLRTAQAIGKQVGIDDVRAELLPEDKLRIVEEMLKSERGVGMVGDGVNDAPALAKATVGFAMGAAGSDTALETADVALMKDDLHKLADYIRLSRATGTILVQNIVLALGIKIVFFTLALTGHATLWMAVFADLGASLLVVGNGMRVGRTK